jgi:hypothetical protein
MAHTRLPLPKLQLSPRSPENNLLTQVFANSRFNVLWFYSSIYSLFCSFSYPLCVAALASGSVCQFRLCPSEVSDSVGQLDCIYLDYNVDLHIPWPACWQTSWGAEPSSWLCKSGFPDTSTDTEFVVNRFLRKHTALSSRNPSFFGPFNRFAVTGWLG